MTVALILANLAAFLLDIATRRTMTVDVLTPYGVMPALRQVGGLADAYAMVPANLVADL
ncbi:MAG: rhomboid family intramembrane serine protease, partial [Armatimonadetes bacterium]|nr:rhomboid family intramembrane serine protease [Armatimonadota bacterium]